MTERKYAIIAGEIYKLIRIEKGKDWTRYGWRLHEEADWYWVPIKDWYKESHLSSRIEAHFEDLW